MARAAHIATGNELLDGRTRDVNSAAAARRLTAAGFIMTTAVTVGDDRRALARVLGDLSAAVEVVIVSGGLGPTDDDITRETLAELYGLDFVVHAPSADRMERFFISLQREVGEDDRKMVMVPRGATVLDNGRGLAPGFIIDRGTSVIVALPGVPDEASLMIDGAVISYLAHRFPDVSPFDRCLFRIVAMKESAINALVNDMLDELGVIPWGITAQGGQMTVAFTAASGVVLDRAILREAMERRFGVHLLIDAAESPVEELLVLLRERGQTLALAESCTGGLVAKQITDVPGASSVFRGAIVAYANEVKQGILGVPDGILSEFGAVSEESARLMATGVRERLDADIGAAVTGIAGPDGGSAEKPVGTVWFAFDIAGRTSAFRLKLEGSRDWVRTRSALVVIDYLRRELRTT